MENVIAILALLLTCISLHLQRVHNAKSLKPLGQINLVDTKKQIYIYIQNSGVGPLIIDELTFTKDGIKYFNISDCLKTDPKSYYHMLINDTVKKIVAPNANFIVFENNIENYPDSETEIIRKQLSLITLNVYYRDIYDNKFNCERNLDWFSRHMPDEAK